MGCSIVRNDEGRIVEVFAPNGNNSILFSSINRIVGDNEYNYGAQLWAQVYTPSFKTWYNKDWENTIDTNFQDINGEPILFYSINNLDLNIQTYSGNGIPLSREYVDNAIPVFVKPGDYKSYTSEQLAKDNIDKQSLILDNIKSNITTLIDNEVYLANPNNILKLEFKNRFTFEEANTTEISEFSSKSMENIYSSDFITQFANALSEQTGINYEFLSEGDAKELTKNSKNPYTNQPAFFYNDKVYFVGKEINTDTALHEFMHPVVRALRNENPELFNSLFNEITKSPEGKLLYQQTLEEYVELENDIYAKEELLVKTITNLNLDKIQGKLTKENSSLLDKLLYQIRQLFRKIFGSKLDISKINSNSSLKEIADILSMGNKINLNTQSLISEEDIVAYKRESAKLVEELQDLSKSEISAISNNMYTLITKTLQDLKDKGDYVALKSILTNDMGTGSADEMKSNIAKYESVDRVKQATDSMIDEVKETQQRVTALVRNINTLDVMIKKIQTHMKTLKDQTDQKEAMGQMYYYNNLFRTWDIWIDDMIKSMDLSNVDHDSQVYSIVVGIKARIKSSRNLVDVVYSNAVSEALAETLTPFNRNITNKANREIKKLEEGLRKPGISENTRNYLENSIKEEKEKLTSQLVDQDKMKKILAGEMGDAHWANSYLESYLSNNDPAIGSFAVYLKNTITDAQLKAHNKFNDFSIKLEPILKELGYDSIVNKNFQDMAKDLTFVDTIATRDPETGELKEYKVHSLIYEFKNYKYSVSKFNNDVKEAKDKYLEDNTEESRLAWVEAEKIKEEHMKNFFNNQYVDEYYNQENDILSTDIGQEAQVEKNNILSEIRALQQLSDDEYDEYLNIESLAQLWSDYRQLFSTYDIYGKKKEGRDLEKVLALRDNREKTNKFYEWKPLEGAFQRSLKSFELTLTERGIEKGSEDFIKRRKEWIAGNTKSSVKTDFYLDRNKILESINSIIDQTISPADKENKARKFAELWTEIIDITSVKRDNDGQPIGSEMTQEQIKTVKRIQDELELAKVEFEGLNGLTGEETERLSSYYQMMKDKIQLDQEQRKDLVALNTKKDDMGLSKLQKSKLLMLFKELDELQTKGPTDYYLDIANAWYTKVMLPITDETTPVFMSNPEALDASVVETFGDYKYMQQFLDADSEFKEWFESNHIIVKKWNNITKSKENTYQRVYVWNTIKPNNDKYYNKTNIYDDNGNIVETILGIPSMKYSYRTVKDEFKTEKIVGKTIDSSGRWLPKREDQLDKNLPEWDRYINSEYNNLKLTNPKKFELLELYQQYHLSSQEGLDNNQKLGYEIPRYRNDRFEYLTKNGVQGAKNGYDKLKAIGTGIADSFRKAPDDLEEGFNASAQNEFNMVSVDMYSGDGSKIPLTGRYKLDIDQVSLDITKSITEHMLSAEKQKKLAEIQPMAKALQHLVNKQNPSDLKSINKQDKLYRNITNFIPGKSNVRGAAINALVESQWEGKNLTGLFSNNPALQKSIGVLMKSASFSFFAFDIISAAKNHYGAVFQIGLEAAGGKYLNYKDYLRGRPWAFKTMSNISAQIYKTGTKSLDIQLVDIFDPVQGRFDEKLGTSATRSIARDTINGSWTTSHRKWMETEASLQLFAGMMNSTRIDQVQDDGSVKSIRYLDAWELKDGKITLKDGIDKSWDQGGELFKELKNKVHGVSNLLQGAYAPMDQGAANRYVLFRVANVMKKYFVKMLVDRYGMAGSMNPLKGKERYDFALADTQMGFYIRNIQTMKKLLNSRGKAAMYMTQEESRAMIKGTLEFVKLWIIGMLMSFLFGWDPDDKDRLKKLKARSGALPTFITDDKWEENFNTWGWAQNHALLLLMNIESENEHFIPLPGYGMNSIVNFFTGTSVATGPTIETYKDILNQLFYIVSGDKRSIYQKDVGALEWQQSDEKKIWAHVAKMLALKGKTIDPVTAIKNFQSAKSSGL